jgi:hypothetical protein
MQFQTFKERFDYLRLHGDVAEPTFSYDRWVNQKFYRSTEWRQLRRQVIVRDDACDLAMPGHSIHFRPYIHHMNPMTLDQIQHAKVEWILNPEYLITVSLQTHNAIHYGDESSLPRGPAKRRNGDTHLWSPIGRRTQSAT